MGGGQAGAGGATADGRGARARGTCKWAASRGSCGGRLGRGVRCGLEGGGALVGASRLSAGKSGATAVKMLRRTDFDAALQELENTLASAEFGNEVERNPERIRVGVIAFSRSLLGAAYRENWRHRDDSDLSKFDEKK